MNVGDRIRVKTDKDELFAGCEGFIIEGEEEGYYLLDLYKGNGKVTDEELKMYNVYLPIDRVELIEPKVRLNVKELRETKNTEFISTEESLREVEIWFNNQMAGK